MSVPTPRVNADEAPVHWRSKGLYFDAVLIVVTTENLPRKMPHDKVTDSINSNETQGLTEIRKVYITSFFSFQKLLCNPQYRTRCVLLKFRRCRYARSRNSTIRDQSGKSDLEETPSSPINFHRSQQTFPLNKARRVQLKLTSH